MAGSRSCRQPAARVVTHRQDPSWVPQGLLDSAKERTANVVSRLRQAMAEIAKDVQDNEGLYPYNKGRIDQSEVCRRASVSKVTLQGSSHKTTTKKEVDDWVVGMRIQAVTGVRGVRRSVTERAEVWKAAHAKIANHYHLAELELVEARHRIKQLEAEKAALLAQLAKSGASKLVPLKKRP